jgi:hypothetical protein
MSEHQITMNDEEKMEKKDVWANLRYDPEIHFKGLRKTMKDLGTDN